MADLKNFKNSLSSAYRWIWDTDYFEQQFSE
jgi:hypothetical protein